MMLTSNTGSLVAAEPSFRDHSSDAVLYYQVYVKTSILRACVFLGLHDIT